MSKGFDKTSDMWLNDPQVCRDADPEWFSKIELMNFDFYMRKGTPPDEAYRDQAKRDRYTAFLQKHNSTLVAKQEEVATPSFAEILKANPYHDERGRFSTSDAAKFVSIGGVFDRQRQNAASGSPKRRSSTPKLTTEQVKKEIDELNQLGFTTAVKPERWLQVSPKVSPREMADAVFGKDSVAGKKVAGGTLNVQTFKDIIGISGAYGSVVHGAKVELVQRTFDFEKKDVHHDYLKVLPNQRGGGAIKSMFKDSIPMYEKLGMKTVSVFANIDAGGYAWGRYGFDPDNPQDYSSRLKTRFNGVRRDLVDTGAPKEVIAELDSLTKLVTDKANDKSIARLVSAAKTSRLDAYLKDGFKPNKKTFVQEMLHSFGWDGTLNLKDKSQRAHLNAYIGDGKG